MKKKGLKVLIPDEVHVPFSWSSAGTFKEGDLTINKKGLLIGGASPKTPEVLGTFEHKDLRVLKVVGHGRGQMVQKALHEPSKRLVALKVITLNVTESVRKQIILELKTLYRTQSEYVVTFFDAFYSEGSISIALEYMDGGSLADHLRASGSIPERALSNILSKALKGLAYLHKSHLIHRDIKPSNLLMNTKGELKIADFGACGQLANSMSSAVTGGVGTAIYMSPERIVGKSYSYASDIWSLGITVVECALGRYPYPYRTSTGEQMGFWELLDFVVKAPAPSLPPDRFSPELCAFVSACLQKEPEERPTAQMLLVHPFITRYANATFNMAEWVLSLVT